VLGLSATQLLDLLATTEAVGEHQRIWCNAAGLR
jgi:hypothetical protein